MSNPAPITTKVAQPVEAKLVLVPEHGPQRDATLADLVTMGFVKRLDVYAAANRALTTIMGVTDEHRMDLTRWRDGESIANLVRYFIETAICYHDLGDVTYPASYEEMAERIVAHFTQDDGDGNYGTRLRAGLGDQHRDATGEYLIGERVKVNGRPPVTLLRFNHAFPEQALAAHGDGSWCVIDFENDEVERILTVGTADLRAGNSVRLVGDLDSPTRVFTRATLVGDDQYVVLFADGHETLISEGQWEVHNG